VTTTLLAVDDSKTMRKVLEITFGVDGFRAIIAGSADDALGKLQAERPQVALVDAGLDGTNGYDLCQRIKSMAPSTAVVILSSKQQPYDRARGAAAGADDFVDKPFDTQQLLDKVTVLARKAQSAAAAPAPAPAPMPVAAPAPAPIAARPPMPAAAAAQPERQRVQTLSYGASQAPTAMQAAAPQAAPKMAPPPASAPRPTFSEPAPAARPAAYGGHAAPVAAAVAGTNGADFAQKLGGLGLTQAQIEGVLALSREVVEKVVWEVVPTLAEALIKEEIQRLTAE
jgi:DNA-binding response OmpR family regulator